MSIPDDTQTTHSTECWKWHLECAGREVERLRGELARERKQSELAWSKADEWGAEALEAHQKNARLWAQRGRLTSDEAIDAVLNVRAHHSVPPAGVRDADGEVGWFCWCGHKAATADDVERHIARAELAAVLEEVSDDE